MKHVKPNSLLVFICLLFILLTIACKGEVTTTVESKKARKPSETVSVADDRIITVYYFHTTRRCYSCKRIEELTRKAINSRYSDLLTKGKMVFSSINVEKPENKQYVKKYQLFTKSVVISDMVKGKEVNWKRLDKTWNLLGDSGAFHDYIDEEIAALIQGGS